MDRFHRFVIFFILLFFFAACGNVATQADGSTLTAEERAAIQTINVQAKAMIAAAKDLQALGQEPKAPPDWEGKVRTAARVIADGQKTIAQAALPGVLVPLAQQVHDTAATCAKPVDALGGAGTITPVMVKSQNDALQLCVLDLGQLQVLFRNL